MKSTVSSKGQITIPIEIREHLGLKTGTPVLFQKHPQGALLRKGTQGTHPVDQVFGSLVAQAPVDTLIEELRGPRAEEPPARTGRSRRKAGR